MAHKDGKLASKEVSNFNFLLQVLIFYLRFLFFISGFYFLSQVLIFYLRFLFFTSDFTFYYLLQSNHL